MLGAAQSQSYVEVNFPIHPDMIGMLIGPKGANIRGIQERHDVEISVEDDTVYISGGSQAAVDAARAESEFLCAVMNIPRDFGKKSASMPQ